MWESAKTPDSEPILDEGENFWCPVGASTMHKSQRIPSFPRQRRSACADAALKAEIERVKKMPVRERMLEALALGRELPTMVENESIRTIADNIRFSVSNDH